MEIKFQLNTLQIRSYFIPGKRKRQDDDSQRLRGGGWGARAHQRANLKGNPTLQVGCTLGAGQQPSSSGRGDGGPAHREVAVTSERHDQALKPCWTPSADHRGSNPGSPTPEPPICTPRTKQKEVQEVVTTEEPSHVLCHRPCPEHFVNAGSFLSGSCY